jgi:hypothetical protein
MTWNIEHMNSWWEAGDTDPAVMRTTFGGDNFSAPITDVPDLARRVGNVINAVDPDVVTIQEGPGIPEINDFISRFVNGDNWQVLRGSGGRQALVVAARLDRDVSAIVSGPEFIGDVNLNEPFNADINADLVIDDVNFARRPQVISLSAHGQELLLLNNHLKSKFVRHAEEKFNAGGEQRLSFFAAALEARRRISGEAFRIRAFLDEIFSANPTAQVIVTGDLNDGPGADFFEENFLTYSVVDRIFGSIFHPDQQLTHVLLHGNSTDFTAQFFDFIAGETKDLVLDHIGLSKAINDNWNWQGRVAVAEYEAQRVNNPSLHGRDRLPSDHRPVVVEMTPK